MNVWLTSAAETEQLSSFPASVRVIVPPTTSASVMMYVACDQPCFTAIQFISTDTSMNNTSETEGCVSAVSRQTRVLALN